MKVGRREVAITRPEKELFPGVTKRDLCEYHARIAPAMLPHVKGRPLMLERYPDGIGAQRVMQKNASAYFPEWITRARVRKHGGSVEHVVANDAATLVYLANQAAITLHTWLSDIEHPKNPDQLIIDLDPTGCDWDVVAGVARLTRDVLIDAGLVPFVKTSGSRGLHIHAPLDRRSTFDEVGPIGNALAVIIADADPHHVTTQVRKAKRDACLFLDLGRNTYAQTAVAPFSVRAREGAPVAVPIAWEELDDRRFRPDGFTMADAVRRVEGGVDPWKGWKRHARSIKRVDTSHADDRRRHAPPVVRGAGSSQR